MNPEIASLITDFGLERLCYDSFTETARCEAEKYIDPFGDTLGLRSKDVQRDFVARQAPGFPSEVDNAGLSCGDWPHSISIGSTPRCFRGCVSSGAESDRLFVEKIDDRFNQLRRRPFNALDSVLEPLYKQLDLFYGDSES